MPPTTSTQTRPEQDADRATDHYDVVVVGAGPAGISAALRAAELGASVAVVEGGELGGTCVNTGCVPTRVLARAARLLRDVRLAGEFGVDVPEPAVAWERTTARVRRVVEEVRATKDVEGQLAAAGVHLVRGWARFTGPQELAVSGRARGLRAEAVVLATGGRSRRLDVEGVELTTVPERVVELERLPASVAVVGSGYTGSQLVTIFSSFGVRVTLVELADRVLPTADADVSAALERAFRSDGVDVRTGVQGLARVEELPDGLRRVVLRTASGEEHVDVEAVVVCAGWPARLEGLGLEVAGVEATASRIPVDRTQRTSSAHVWVAGDADGDAALVQAGVADGLAAATNAVTGAGVEVDHSVLPSGGFTDPDYAQIGLTEERAREAHPDALVALVPYAHLERAVIDARTTGFLKLVATADAGRLLGAHAVGESALEVVQAVATAMTAGASVRALAATEYAYPTYTAVIGLAAQELLRTAGQPQGPAVRADERASATGAGEPEGSGEDGGGDA